MKIVLLLLVFSLSTMAHSESITIRQKGGNETILDLLSNPVITFSGENMVVTNDFTTISIPIDDIDSYLVGETITGITKALETPQFSNGHIYLKGFSKGMAANIYTIDGKNVGEQSVGDSGIIDINLGNFPKGVYIISTPNRKVKFINK